MKKLSDYLSRLQANPQNSGHQGVPLEMDEKTVIFLAEKVLRSLYGMKGKENMYPVRYQGKKLYFAVSNSLWVNELWLERENIREKINKEIGKSEVAEIKVYEK